MKMRNFKLATTNWKLFIPWTIKSVQKNSSNYLKCCAFSSSIEYKSKICVVGAGPSGFYATQFILKTLPNAQIDIIEKLPVPFGLVRFGVAPDHPEVKNVTNTFTKIAENPRVRFIGNISLGKDVSLHELRNLYNAVLLCYGAEQDRKMGINDEDRNVLSAREFVAWYNGLPSITNSNVAASIESQIKNCDTVTIIGQGNVAVDVARILLSSIDVLRKTDITNRSLATLSECKIQTVHLVGRRGPLQAAFTIKELREMLTLSNVNTIWRVNDFTGIDENTIKTLARPKKRLIELMYKHVHNSNPIHSSSDACKQFMPIFYRSPKFIESNSIVNDGDNTNNSNGNSGVNAKRLHLTINQLTDSEMAVATDQIETLQTKLILRSIGYKSINVTRNDDSLNFDSSKGLVSNEFGRVLKLKALTVPTKTSINVDDKYERGLYVSGWLATGPTGVILTTMNNSFMVAKHICQDIQNNFIDNSIKAGLDLSKYPMVVTWNDWIKIDKYEIERGTLVGKPREKILSISEMLEIVK